MKNWKKYINYALYAIGLGIVGYLILEYNPVLIFEQITEMSWYFLAIIALWAIVYVLNAASWSYIIKSNSVKLPFSLIYGLTISGYAINYITPFVMLGGEPYRVLTLDKYMPRQKATIVVLQNSVMHIYSHIWYWVLGLIILIFELGLNVSNYILILASAFFIIGMFFLFNRLFNRNFTHSIYSNLSKLTLFNKLTQKYGDKAEYFLNLDRQMSTFYEDKNSFYKSLSFEFFGRIIGALEFLIILRAIGIDISIAESIYISAASSLIANIIFFMPMQLGIREGSLYFIFQSLGINAELGIFVSLVTRIRELFCIIAGFMIIPFISKKNKVKIYEN